MPRPEVSLVIPIYNEEDVLPVLEIRLRALLETIRASCEVIFVDDGSKDRSIDILREMVERDPRYRALSFSRNFGHQSAITCGMDASRGKAIVVMDADLQDPPEVVVEMIAKWREGYDVVYGRRRTREGETWFKLFTAKMFYRLFAAMIPIEVPLDAGDFRLMSRRVVVAMRELRETHRFVRGLVSWMGFKQTAVEYDRAARAAGETKYPLKKMLAFAFDGIMSFSILPLRLATYLGVFVGTISVFYAFTALFAHSVLHTTVPGWTTTVVLVSLLFSVQLLVTGVLGEYVGRIYEEVKRRPLYVVGERIRHKRIRKRTETQSYESEPELVAELPRSTARPPVGIAPPHHVSPHVPPPALVPPPPSSSSASSSGGTSFGGTPRAMTPAPPSVRGPASKPAPPLPSASKYRDKP